MNYPNQEEYAYAAGLFDGEGTVLIDKNNRIRMEVKMTDESGIDEMHRIFGGTKYRARNPLSSGRSAYKWQTAGQTTIDAAAAMYPYSKTKKRQLQVLLNYADRFPVNAVNTTKEDKTAELEVRSIAAAQLRALKSIDPQALIFDIETMGLDMSRLPMLSCSYQRGNDEEGVWKSWKEGPDEEGMLLRVRETLEAAPWTMGFNSIRFDIPYINTRLALYGHRAMFLGSHEDVSEMYKAKTGRSKRTSLHDMANELSLTDGKVHKTPIDWDIWHAADRGDEDAMSYVLEHGDMDVILTKRGYDAIIGNRNGTE